MSRFATNYRRQDGLTLVELLIVVSLLTLLAAVALPTFKAVVTERKANQAGVVVKAVFESARAQAVGRQREVAVILERAHRVDSTDLNVETALGDWNQLDYDPILSNSVYRLSYAEILPPYRGDLEGSVVQLQSDPTFLSNAVNQAIFDLARDPSARYFLNPGDMIAFDDRAERYEILSVTFDSNLPIAFVSFWNAPRMFWDTGSTAYLEMGSLPDRPRVELARREPFTDNNGSGYWEAVEPFTDLNGNRVYDSNPHLYRVYAKPRRLFSKPIQLPKGTCIDLTLSGIGNSLDNLPNRRGYDFMAIPRMEAYANTDYLTFAPPSIYFVFSPRGSLSSVYFDVPPNLSNYIANDYSLNRVVPTDDIYLFVGRSDQVANMLAGRWDDPANDPNILLPRNSSDRDRLLFNLFDSSCSWIKISSENGQISMAPNHGVHDDSGAANYKQQLAEAREFANVVTDSSAR